MFVNLGIGDSGKEEYHIINRKSGTYMSCGGMLTTLSTSLNIST